MAPIAPGQAAERRREQEQRKTGLSARNPLTPNETAKEKVWKSLEILGFSLDFPWKSLQEAWNYLEILAVASSRPPRRAEAPPRLRNCKPALWTFGALAPKYGLFPTR
jgi:hypothetical protein